MIGLVVAFVLTAVLTYVLGFDEKIEKDQRAIEAEKKNVTFGKKIILKGGKRNEKRVS